MASNKEIRARARNTLGKGIFSSEWLLALVVVLVATVVLGFLSAVIFGVLLVGFVELGTSKYFLCRSRRTIKYDELDVLLDGVKVDFGGNIVLGLLITIFTFLWSLLFVIPGIIKAYSYSMAYYVKIDHPELTPSQAIDESRRIMKGNKMRLFLLDLSFIGWLIIGVLCLGVGTLWVNAYMQTAHAEFYRDVIGDANFAL